MKKQNISIIVFQLSGVAPFAGAPYLTGELTGSPSTDELHQKTLALADAGLIDPVENMRGDQVYIFTGTLDSVVPPGIKLQFILIIIMI